MSEFCEIKTNAGFKLRCELHEDPDHPGLTIIAGDTQIAVIEVTGVFPRILIWRDDKADYTHEIIVRRRQL